MIDARKLLEQANFFRDLSDAGKTAIASICQPRPLRKKDVLFREGERGQAVYILATGNIRLVRTTPEGREVVLKILQPGEYFGEVILFERDRYPVTATATVASTVLAIPRLQLHQLLATTEFRNDFIAMLMKKQRYLADRVYQLTSVDLDERFFQFINEHYGPTESVAMTFAKKEIAAAIGATPETFSRLILRLKRDHILRWAGRKIQFRKDFWKKRE